MPNDDKYKSVKTSNAKVGALILSTPGALEAMEAIGWQHEEEQLRCAKPMTMSQVSSQATHCHYTFVLGSWSGFCLVMAPMGSLCSDERGLLIRAHATVDGC